MIGERVWRVGAISWIALHLGRGSRLDVVNERILHSVCRCCWGCFLCQMNGGVKLGCLWDNAIRFRQGRSGDIGLIEGGWWGKVR